MELRFNRLLVNIKGESHSTSLEIEMHGFPEGEKISKAELQRFMDRRHGDDGYISELCGTGRREPDEVVFDSGLNAGNPMDEETVGITDSDILCHIDNKDVRSNDYNKLRTVLRPGHADLGAYLKYGKEGLKPGGGEFSGRMTAAYCVAGGIAKQILAARGITIESYVLQMGGMETAFLDEEDEEEFFNRLEAIKESGDSCGGIVGCIIKDMPGGIGGPGMDGLEGDFARAMLAIPSAKGIEFGSGFEGSYSTGAANNDDYYLQGDRIVAKTNRQGGISGGISTGMNITMNVAFKPVPSIAISQRTVDIETMQETTVETTGRHDFCIIPRVLPVVEAMAALVVLDRLETENE